MNSFQPDSLGHGVSDIRTWKENKYDLSINRYREIEYEEATFDPPHEIMKRLRSLNQEISRDMDELEALLK